MERKGLESSIGNELFDIYQNFQLGLKDYFRD